MARRSIVVVLGCHRSGTSLLMDALARMGVRLGDDLLAADEWNTAGYHELAPIFRVQEEVLTATGRRWTEAEGVFPVAEHHWGSDAMALARQRLTAIVAEQVSREGLWGFKDPRTASLLPLWHEIFDALDLEPVYLLALRHPEAVAASLARRDGLPLPQGRLLWLRTHYEALRHAGRIAAVAVYERWFEDPHAQLVEIAHALAPALGREPTLPDAARFVRQDLRHEHSTAMRCEEPGCASLVEEAWSLLSARPSRFVEAARFVSDTAAQLHELCQAWRGGLASGDLHLINALDIERLGREQEGRVAIWNVRLGDPMARCLFQPPPSRVHLELPGREPGTLRVAVALHPEICDRADTGPCRFDVEIDRRITASISLDPARAGDRGWHELALPVPGAPAGHHEIVFATRALGNGESYRWALWREPVLTNKVPATEITPLPAPAGPTGQLVRRQDTLQPRDAG